MKKLIFRLIRKLASFERSKWDSNDAVKILIVTNKYFTENSWRKIIAERFTNESKGWDIVFSDSKLITCKHFEKADACFLYGISDLYILNDKSKLLYFPIVGLEFLESKKLPDKYKIEKPPVFSKKAIAEYCLSQAIAISRGFQFTQKDQFERTWEQNEILKKPLLSITDLKVGILGVGNVGKEIATIFKRNNCYVVGCDMNLNGSRDIDKWYDLNQLNDFLTETDLLIISVPLNSETKNIIRLEELKLLGCDGYLMNVSRGSVVNENDLIFCLKNRLIAGAVLDVFEREPLMPDNKLYDLDNVIITPHIAGNINYFITDIQNNFLKKVGELNSKE